MDEHILVTHSNVTPTLSIENVDQIQ